MSETIIYGFGIDGACTEEAACIPNAFRGAISIWKLLEKKYLPVYRPCYVPESVPDDEIEAFLGYPSSRIFSMSDEAAMKDIWNLFMAENVSETDKIVLGTTFDDVLVRRGNIQRVIDAFEAFDKEHEAETNINEQAKGLRLMIQDPNITAVGWNQTSVNGDDWSNIGDPYVDEDGYEYGGPYNFKTGTNHWWLFDRIGETTEASNEEDK